MLRIPRVMIAAMRSGSGKTLLTMGFLRLLNQKIQGLHAYKCGPDYIDPMFHTKVLGIESRNLDPYFCDKADLNRILSKQKTGYALMEGVMGLYDGIAADTTAGSSYEVAVHTGTPVILIADASKVGRTIISQIKGILLDDKDRMIRGLILNRISEQFYEKLKPVLIKELAEAGFPDVKCLGGIPFLKGIEIDSRHLGLKMPDEIRNINEQIDKVAGVVDKYVDMAAVLDIMSTASDISTYNSSDISSEYISNQSIAIARDEAFCFLYSDNLEIFKERGIGIKYFSPLYDKEIPAGVSALLLPGGYPELYLKELSSNEDMLRSIRNAINSGIPSLAECGGFMYLHRLVRDEKGVAYPLVGVIDGECTYTGHLVRFGYMCIESVYPENAGTDHFPEYIKLLSGMKGHEFHYYDSTSNGSSAVAVKPYYSSFISEKNGNRNRWNCMVAGNNGLWGFPHFYYRSAPAFIYAFVQAMEEYAHGQFK
ncbi:MAG: cobyrinate a,c-diamide synthase [Lachnospiraceae bacterium]|nr:cobyrinate a,c-diamide synthase [Lachnospiraceae bacterium]